MSNAYKFVSLQPYNSPWSPGMVYTVGGYFDISTTVSAAGFTNGDTITATGMIPEGGVTVLQTVVLGAPGDSNGSPTGTFSLGDSLADSNHAARFILAGLLSKQDGAQVLQYQNVTPTITSGAYVKGVGYSYTTNENSNGEFGNVDIVLTATASMATATTSGILYVYVTYLCTGEI